MGLFILLALNVALAAGLALLWRRSENQQAEIAALRAALAALPARAKPRRAAAGEVVALSDGAVIPAPAQPPLARAARAWSLPTSSAEFPLRGPTLSPETARGLTLALMAAAPALGFFFSANPAAIVAAGLAIAAAMMLIALRPIWRAAAWAGVFTASAWALIGFALAAAHADPFSYSFCVAFAGAAGIAHAHLRRATPGATMALAMAAAMLALGSQTGMIGAAGAGFAVIVIAAAIVGAMSLRLEAMHLASFGAAVIGLFVLSGQHDAAIWFTPAAVWTGALFFAIAVVRVPQLGPRGVALAGTGAFAPLGAFAALHAAQHGLASNLSAAGAFFVFACLIGALLAIAATRRPTGLAALRLTLWVLALGAFCGYSAAVTLALPPPLAAAAFAALSFGLAVLDSRAGNAAWRVFAVVAAVFGVAFALLAARNLLIESAALPAWLGILTGFAAPALLLAGAAFLFKRDAAPGVAALFEALALIFAIVAADLVVRLVFAIGAPRLAAIGFVETAVHAALWLGAALLLGLRAPVSALRAGAMRTLFVLAIFAMTAGALLWLSGYWSQRPVPLVLRDTLGFLLPSLLFLGHWLYWRRAGAELEARVSLGAGAVLLAAFLTAEALRMSGVPNWGGALIGAFSFAMAVGVNFAPGVVKPDPAFTPRDRSPSRAAKPTAR